MRSMAVAGDPCALNRYGKFSDGPAFGRIAEFAVAADPSSLAGDAAQSGFLGERADLSQQHRVAGKAAEKNYSSKTDFIKEKRAA
jgi:hypothetical protein